MPGEPDARAAAETRLIAAIDTTSPERARALSGVLAPYCALIKLGLEYFTANGPEGVRAMAGPPLFLDLKFHDIPNTVGGAVRAVLPLRPRMLTLHASGGAAMIEAARRAAEDAAADRPLLLAVTVLTSLDAAALQATGAADGPAKQVVRLAKLAMNAGADGIVCSPREVAAIREALGETPVLVVPGIRPAGAPTGDQARVMTPREAVDAGADWIVVGRPITDAPDPAAAATAILAELDA